MAFIEKKVAVTIKFKAKKGKGKRLAKALSEAGAAKRVTEGCINYSVHRHAMDADLFVTHEVWENMEFMQKEVNAAHLGEFSKKHEGLLEKDPIPEIWELLT